MKSKKFLMVLVFCAICAICGSVQAQVQPPLPPPRTPLAALWPYMPATVISFTATRFYAGDYVCLDNVNTTGTTLYVVDCGTVRCPIGQPQAGIVWVTDQVPTTTHQIMIQPDLLRTSVCPLGECPAANLLPPCNAVRRSFCSK
jgi:hypothetical protein